MGSKPPSFHSFAIFLLRQQIILLSFKHLIRLSKPKNGWQRNALNLGDHRVSNDVCWTLRPDDMFDIESKTFFRLGIIPVCFGFRTKKGHHSVPRLLVDHYLVDVVFPD